MYSSFLLSTLDPFACGCDMAWLIRDNRNLLPVVYGGTCNDSNSTLFEDLNPGLFDSCQ